MKPLVYCYDDDEDTMRVLARLLERAGDACVKQFGSSDEVLAATLARPPDLLVTDEHHPGPSGLEITATVRRSARAKEVPIWIISGVPPTRHAALAAGVTNVVSKPVTAEELARHLQDLFGSVPRGPADLDAEAPDLDIKEWPDFSNALGKASIAKDVIALANLGGGHIVFGKRDDGMGGFEWVGLSDEHLADLEVSRLNRALNEYLDPSIHLSVTRVPRRGIMLAVVRVPAGPDLVMAARQHDEAKLFRGRIYVRTDNAETTEAKDAHDVRRIVDRLVRQRSG